MLRWLPALPVLLVPLAIVVVGQFVDLKWAKIPPTPWVGVVTALGFAAWAAIGGKKPRWVDLIATAAVAIAAGHLFFTPGFPRGHDITTHLWGIWGFFQAILDGDLYPRWLHHLGLGMPLIQFYPPVSFFLLLPFLPLDLAPFDALKFGFIWFSVLAGISMYRVVARQTGDRRAGLVSALAYVWAPYMLLDSHYRVALAEGAAFIFAPLFFDHGIRALRQPSRKHFAWAALAAGLLIITHPLSASMAVTGIAIWITVEWFPFKVGFGPWAKKLLAFAAVGVLALMAAGFYTVPLAAEAPYASIGSALGSAKNPLYTKHGLKPWQPIEPRRWSAWQKSETTGSEKDKANNEQPFYFGLGLLLVIPLAAAYRRREDEGIQAGGTSPPSAVDATQKAPAGLIAVAIAGVVLTLRPFDLLGYLPNFTMLQFSWRFFWLGTMGAAWCAGYGALKLMDLAQDLPGGSMAVRLAPGVLGAILVFDGFPYTGAASWGPAYETVADQVYSRKACDTGPDCWEAREITKEVPFRAEGTFFFPPADYDINLSLFKRVYPEYQTPAVRKSFYSRARKDTLDDVLKELHVGWSFSGSGPKPRVIDDLAPYAEFKTGGKSEPLEFTRKAGVITVKLPKKGGQVIVKEQYFPGWMFDTIYGPQDVNPTDSGLLQKRVGADETEVVFYFSELRGDRFAGWALSGLTLLGLFWPGKREEEEDKGDEAPASAREDGDNPSEQA